MLRITVHDNLCALTFQLEGRLAGLWVRVLQECWQSALARQRRPMVRVDLTGMTSIDAAGRACLAALHHQGAELVAADCLTKAVVAEITQIPLADLKRRKDAGESNP
jgi:ABC-type transporter Mla MlaB component